MDCGEKRREKKIAIHMSIRFVTLTSHYLVFLGINVSVTLLSVICPWIYIYIGKRDLWFIFDTHEELWDFVMIS